MNAFLAQLPKAVVPLWRPAVLMLLGALGGCATVVTVTQPREYILDNKPPYLWVTRRSDQTTIRLETPSVERDTLVGYVTEVDEVRIPLSDITLITDRRPATGQVVKIAVGVGSVAGVGFIIYYATHQHGSPRCTGVSC